MEKSIGMMYQEDRKCHTRLSATFMTKQLTYPASVTFAVLARCAHGQHDPETKYGIVGILCAVLCFPCGLICLW